jgi:hypothetical protein
MVSKWLVRANFLATLHKAGHLDPSSVPLTDRYRTEYDLAVEIADYPFPADRADRVLVSLHHECALNNRLLVGLIVKPSLTIRNSFDGYRLWLSSLSD